MPPIDDTLLPQRPTSVTYTTNRYSAVLTTSDCLRDGLVSCWNVLWHRLNGLIQPNRKQ